MSEKTPVVNLHHLKPGWQHDPDYVYIGRPGKGLKGPFGNPYRLIVGPQRKTTLKRYRAYLLNKLNTDSEFRIQVAELSGKTLVCFCKPRECHGDILAEYADALAPLLWWEDVPAEPEEEDPTQDYEPLPEVELSEEVDSSDAEDE